MAISKIEISFEEYKRLLLIEKLYNALESAGVDNWDGYPDDKIFDLMNKNDA